MLQRVMRAWPLLLATFPVSALEVVCAQETTKGSTQGAEPADLLLALDQIQLDLLAGKPIEDCLALARQVVEGAQLGSEQEKIDDKLREYVRLKGQALLASGELLMRLGRNLEAMEPLQECRQLAKRHPELLDPCDALLRKLALQQSSQLSEDAQVAELVLAEIQRGNFQGLIDMGSIAMPGLEGWIREEAYWMPDTSRGETDPLSVLLQIDPRRAGAFALANYELGPIFRKRVATAMEESGVLRSLESWTGKAPNQCLQPEWLQVLERFVEDPLLGSEVMESVKTVVAQGGTSPRLREALHAILAAKDSQRAGSLLAMLHQSSVHEDMRPWIEAELSAAHGPNRLVLANILGKFGPTPALLRLVADPDDEIRLVVARSLRVGDLLPSAEEPQRSAADKLSQDPSPAVRMQVFELLSGRSGEYFGADEKYYLRWATDPEREVRALLAERISTDLLLPNELHIKLLLTLAADSDPRILDAVDHFLNLSFGTPFPRYLPVLDARLDSQHNPLRSKLDGPRLGQLFQAAAISDEGLNWLARRGLEHKEDDLLQQLLSRGQENLLRRLDVQFLAPYLTHLAERDVSAAYAVARDIRAVEGAKQRSLLQGLQKIANDPMADLRLRLIAVGQTSAVGDSTLPELAQQIMLDSRWRDGGAWQDSSWLVALLESNSNKIPDSAQNKLVLAVLPNPEVALSMRRLAANFVRPDAEFGTEAMEEVLRQLQNDAAYNEGVARCIVSLGVQKNARGEELLRRMLHHDFYWRSAFKALQRSQNPNFLPDLVSLFDSAELDDDVCQSAIETLGSYLSTQAAAALLVVAQRVEPQWHEFVLTQVEKIRSYQRKRLELADSQRTIPTRESALAELLELVQDKDAQIRAAAARGLASLGAVEALPTLVRLLNDREASVREAAQAALSRLERMELTPAQPAREPAATGGE